MTTPRYRPEIDGLRAIAVMAVLLYHAGVPGFGGGYVGVDIFFVISGFLITGIIRRPIAGGTFSIVDFYERRARRILPALVAMFVFTTVGAVLIMPPRVLSGYGADLIGAALSFSNVRFWKTSGYFNGAAEFNPLIHTWSLAVEEQFYLFYPLVLAALHKWFARSVPALLAAGLLLSLGLSIWAAEHAPMAGFYLIPTRAWELLAGGLLTFLPQQTWRTGWANLTSLFGVAMLTAAIVLFTDATPFPGWQAALPVAGTVLLIAAATPATVAGKLLTFRPIVLMGLISYSLYLVHQPIFALLRTYQVFELGWLQKVITLLLCIAIAYLSWRWVEQPFRAGGAALKTRKAVFQASGLALSASVLVGLALNWSGGWPQRFSAEKMALLRSDIVPEWDSNCIRGYEDTRATPCTLGFKGANIRIAVLGDSHAWQLIPVLNSLAVDRKWQIDVFAKAACPPGGMDFVYTALHRRYKECEIWGRQLPNLGATYDVILITASSAGYRSNQADPIEPERWHRHLEQLFGRLGQSRASVIWGFDTPKFKAFDPRLCVERAALFESPVIDRCRLPSKIALDTSTRQIEQAVASSKNVKVIDLATALCDDHFCEASLLGRPAMRDNNHIEPAAAQKLRALLEETFDQEIADKR